MTPTPPQSERPPADAEAPRTPTTDWHLSKSRYLAGIQCERRVWLQCRAPERATPTDAAKQALFDAGANVGRRAHALFPGGVLVEEGPEEHGRAIERTRVLMRNRRVPAIFEAAFECEGIRIRVDILERMSFRRWGLREVKSSTRLKDEHLDDVALQHYVLRRCGLWIGSIELIHVNPGYLWREPEIEWSRFFLRANVRRESREARRRVGPRLAGMRRIVAARAEPAIEPWRHCSRPVACEFWDRCTRPKPDDWIFHLPRLREKTAELLRKAGIDRIAHIPDDVALNAVQARAREAVRSGQLVVDPELRDALRGAGPPALYLDFETTAPVVPLYPDTRPYQQIPFQWSLHSLSESGALAHREFLASGESDPRREFAESLIEAIGSDVPPILVYSPFEDTRLRELSEELPDLALPLSKIRSRLVDLLKSVRDCVYHPDFQGSFSLKQVAPALGTGVDYVDLDGIAGGAEAAAAFPRLARGELPPEQASALRRALLAYCERDTLALVELHRALREAAR